jgi:hypothetical protein
MSKPLSTHLDLCTRELYVIMTYNSVSGGSINRDLQLKGGFCVELNKEF